MASVEGALTLADGRLLSWAGSQLRLWDSQSGALLAVLEGHTDWVRGTLALTNGRLLSWSDDKTLRLWDSQGGACLEVIAEDEAPKRRPEWLHARAEVRSPACVSLGFFLGSSDRVAQLRHRTSPILIVAWNADSDAATRCLLPDGTAVVTQSNGQVCILKLHHGQRCVTLAEAEAVLPQSRKET
jgi:WD40 repeat protein